MKYVCKMCGKPVRQESDARSKYGWIHESGSDFMECSSSWCAQNHASIDAYFKVDYGIEEGEVLPLSDGKRQIVIWKVTC